MQEQVIETSCDIDFFDDDVRVEATEVISLVETGEVYVIDMCVNHRKSTSVLRLPEVALHYGRPLSERRSSLGIEKPKAKKTKKKPAAASPGEESGDGRLKCEYPECESDAKNEQSLSAHFKTQHGIRLTAWRAQQAGEKLRYCVCGDGFAKQQGLTNHVSASREGTHHAVTDDDEEQDG